MNTLAETASIYHQDHLHSSNQHSAMQIKNLLLLVLIAIAMIQVFVYLLGLSVSPCPSVRTAERRDSVFVSLSLSLSHPHDFRRDLLNPGENWTAADTPRLFFVQHHWTI